jgi:hypothetical protein
VGGVKSGYSDYDVFLESESVSRVYIHEKNNSETLCKKRFTKYLALSWELAFKVSKSGKYDQNLFLHKI